MKNITFLILVLLLIFTNSCSNETIYNKVTEVNYGTSFGMCVGYCKHDVSIDSIHITYNCSSWNQELKTLTRAVNTSKSTWDSVKVVVNMKEFFLLPETIGCPDCADGGAEWLDVKLINGEKHKVTFEYNNEPELLKTYLAALRVLMNKNECVE